MRGMGLGRYRGKHILRRQEVAANAMLQWGGFAYELPDMNPRDSNNL